MGWKSYYCDYCKCYLRNNVSVRKNHNAGLAHSVAKCNYMRQFATPGKILAIERLKKPCQRYWRGSCKFGALCQYGHYTPAQLKKLKFIARRFKRKRRMLAKKKSRYGCYPTLPWQTVTSPKISKPRLPKKLPPSLQPIDFKLLTDDIEIKAWGEVYKFDR